MNIKVDLSVLTIDDILTMKEALRQYDCCEGIDDVVQFELFEIISKINLVEIRE